MEANPTDPGPKEEKVFPIIPRDLQTIEGYLRWSSEYTRRKYLYTMMITLCGIGIVFPVLFFVALCIYLKDITYSARMRRIHLEKQLILEMGWEWVVTYVTVC